MCHEHDGDQSGQDCSECRQAPRHEEGYDGKHVQGDRDFEDFGRFVRCELRLENGRKREHDGEGDSAGAARKQAPRLDEQLVDDQRVHGSILAASDPAAPRASKRSSGSPRRVTNRPNSPRRVSRKTALGRDAAD